MGLDITSYANLTPAPNAELEDGYPKDYRQFVLFGSSMKWSESVWPGRGAPWDPDTVYGFTARQSFRAGSYSGYNSWRLELADLAQGNDFSELINFADNEGVIGSIVSEKLAADFARNEDRADQLWKGDEYSRQLYAKWQKAFEMAAHNGAVEFH